MAGAVFLLALGLRLLLLFSASDRAWPHNLFYEGDAPLWAEWAAALDRGTSFNFDLPIWPPGVAYVMHWLLPTDPAQAAQGHTGALGRDFTRLKLLWCVLSAATWAIVYFPLRRTIGRRAALVAVFLGSFSFGSYVISTSLNNETPYLFLLVLIVALALRLRERPALIPACVWGGLNGLATYFRPEHPLAFVLLAGFIVIPHLFHGLRSERKPVGSKNRSDMRRAAAFAAGSAALSFLITLGPWIARSHAAVVWHNTELSAALDFDHAVVVWQPDARAFIQSLPAFTRQDIFRFTTDMFAQAGRRTISAAETRQFLVQRFQYIPEPLSPWTIASSQGPLSFALANHPLAGGGFSKAAFGEGASPDAKLRLSQPAHLRLFNHGYALGWGWIQANPGKWVELIGKKLAHFTSGVTLGLGAQNFPLGRIGTRRVVDMLGAPAGVWSVLIVVCLLSGLVIGVRRGGVGIWLLLIAYKLIVTVLFYGYARQAVSIQPAFLALVAIAVDAALGHISTWQPRLKRVFAFIGAGLALVALFSDLWSAAHPTEARYYGKFHPAPEYAPNAIISPDELTIGR